ncbi:MAG TPA: Asp-tRNA(Asn)/Glu-tRNA(Gln) amidotransferase subunit GatC [Candidatus Paceibacterota bacterium]
MTKISKKDVEQIASLARLGLNDKEKEKMADELGSILGYIDKLNEVNTDGVEPVAHATGLENIMRQDVAVEKPLGERAVESRKLVDMSPESENGFVKVPAVFEES